MISQTNLAEVGRLLDGLTDEDYRNALSYLQFLFERSERERITARNEAAMLKIQSLVGGNRGWASEEAMLEDMAEFRRGRTL